MPKSAGASSVVRAETVTEMHISIDCLLVSPFSWGRRMTLLLQLDHLDQVRARVGLVATLNVATHPRGYGQTLSSTHVRIRHNLKKKTYNNNNPSQLYHNRNVESGWGKLFGASGKETASARWFAAKQWVQPSIALNRLNATSALGTYDQRVAVE
jgi:hypothetical protein